MDTYHNRIATLARETAVNVHLEVVAKSGKIKLVKPVAHSNSNGLAISFTANSISAILLT